MAAISKISVFSSISLDNASSIILYKENDPDNINIYEHLDLSKKINKTTDYYIVTKDYFETNCIIFLINDSDALGYVLLVKDLIEGTNTTNNIKTIFNPQQIHLYIEDAGKETLREDVSLIYKLVSIDNNTKFKNVLCEESNITEEVPVNRYGTVMSPNTMVLNGWYYKKNSLWKLQANKNITVSFDFTGWNTSFMFYKGDPSIYIWKDDQFSIQSLTRKTQLGTAYPYTQPIGDESTVIHTFKKGNIIDWVYGDFIKSGDNIYFWTDKKEYCEAKGYIIDHFSMQNKLYTKNTIIELKNLYKSYKNYDVTDKYGDWVVYDGRIFVNSKFYKEFEATDNIIPLNNRALLNLSEQKIYCSNGEVLDSLDTYRRNTKQIIEFEEPNTIILTEMGTKDTTQGNVLGSIGSLIYYKIGKDSLSYL